MLKPIKGHPGRFLDQESGKILDISEYREDDKYDTICIYAQAVDPITAGKQYVFFRDVMRKLPIDTNFTQPSRLTAGEKMVVDRVGVSVENDVALIETPDVYAIAANAHLRVNVNSLLLVDGPVIKFASGYGLSGNSVAVLGIANIGVPSPAAVGKLLKPQTLTDNHEIIGYLTFYDRSWANLPNATPQPIVWAPPKIIAPQVFVKCWLHGLVKAAVNK